MRRIGWIAGVMALLCAIPAVAQNLVTNPGFETGTLSGWTVTAAGGIVTTTSHPPPHTGSYAADFQASTCCPSSLSQTIGTTSGQNYTFSFYYSAVGGASPNELKVLFNGTQIGDYVNQVNDGYHFATYTVTATSASSIIGFSGYSGPGDFGFDDVSFVASGSVAPEPSSWALMILGVGIVGAALRLRQRAFRAQSLRVAQA